MQINIKLKTVVWANNFTEITQSFEILYVKLVIQYSVTHLGVFHSADLKLFNILLHVFYKLKWIFSLFSCMLQWICYGETPKSRECQHSLVNVNIHIVAWYMSEIFAKYPYFWLSLVNVDFHHALMVNVEHVRDLYFLLLNSVAIFRLSFWEE